ncbi:MAG TPA: efflux transporter outer membrane subunit [Allosphingosinicella sp.]|jgi:NodT family efflux transporter outer membrane factor (OMF) lipoprotein|nr:efflux transporter outer membrane subunit [Allosphingosinicella sp.]
MYRFVLAAASALALVSCTTVGPDYKAPSPASAEPSAPAPFASAASPAFTGDEPPGRWWSLFRDSVLDGLVAQALAANTDLRVAAANLAQARAVLRETRAGRLPTTGLSGGATYANQPGPGGAEPELSAGFDVGYQLDLFGRIRRATEASRADVEAVQAAFDVARITVAAETARAYADACSSGRQLQVARESVRIQEETFDLTRRLVAGGRGTALDTGQAGALMEQVRAQVPTLEAERRAALYRLAVLTGRPPADFPPVVATCVTPPSLSQPVPVGDGASLLARRPDIRRAERELAAATARIGVATAELYPDISLGLSVGSTASSIGGLASGSGFRFGLGPLISWTFPNRTVARSRIAQAEAGAQAALARFDGTWLGALEETETALTRYARELDRAAILRRARANSLEAARVARLRYRAGRESFQIVLDAERSLSQIEADLARSEAQLSTNLVSVFLALGGGWQG